MHQHSPRDTWTAGGQYGPETTPESMLKVADSPGALGAEVLAQIPDLHLAEPRATKGKKAARSDGRVISQGLSTKILFGGAALMVALAIIPLMFNKSDPNQHTDGPSQWQPGSPAFSADQAPPWHGGATQTPSPAPTVLTEQAPRWDGQSQVPPMDAGPPAPFGVDPSQAALPKTPNTPAGEVPSMPSLEGPPARYGGRFEAAPPQPGYYRQHSQPQPGANQPTSLDDYGPGRQTDYRRSNQADSRSDPRGYPPHMIDPPRTVDPGVARLEGIIVKPSGSETHERVRSGLY